MNQEDSPALRPYPSKIIVETTTRCNLSCPMCVKTVCSDDFTESDMTISTFEAKSAVSMRGPGTCAGGIGEPLLNPYLHGYISVPEITLVFAHGLEL